MDDGRRYCVSSQQQLCLSQQQLLLMDIVDGCCQSTSGADVVVSLRLSYHGRGVGRVQRRHCGQLVTRVRCYTARVQVRVKARDLFET